MPLVRRARRSRAPISFDTETTGLNRWVGHMPFAVSARADGRNFYWEWVVNPRTRKPNVRPRDVEEIRALLCVPGQRKRTWNGGFDMMMLETIGVEVSPEDIDEVSLMARAVNNLEFAYKLKPLAKKYAKIDDSDEAELRAEVVKARKLARRLGYPVSDDVEADYWMPYSLSVLHPREAADAGIDKHACRRYACKDADRTEALGEMYEEAMDDLDVRGTYEHEMKLFPLSLEMQRHGVAIDEPRMAVVRDQCEKKLEGALERLREASGNPEFNINSPKQLVSLLFGGGSVARLPVLKRTAKGQPKTDAEALAPHKSNPVVQDVFTARANSQALKLFFDKYAYLATEDDRGSVILHPGFQQGGTLTWRYVCKEPNLQQVSDPDTTNSIAAEFVVDIRQVFVPRPGYVWYCPDYSQVEVVIFADISQEPALLQAIRDGDDIHAVTAEKVWGGRDNERGLKLARMILDSNDDGLVRAKFEEHGWSINALEKSVDKKIARKRSKSVTFTKIFGGGPLALMRWIGVERPEAVEILRGYDETFPTMVARMKEIERQGKLDGYVLSIFGDRLAVDPWNAYRAVNHKVQASAARLMKRGMVSSAEYLRGTGLDARIIMTIHDELIFEFRKGHDYKRVLRGIRDRMSDHGGYMSIPVKVDMERVTERWSEKEKVAI